MKALIRLHDPQLLVLIRHLCPVLEIPAGRCWDAMPPPKPAYSSSLHGAPQGAWGQQLGGGALRHNPPPPVAGDPTPHPPSRDLHEWTASLPRAALQPNRRFPAPSAARLFRCPFLLLLFRTPSPARLHSEASGGRKQAAMQSSGTGIALSALPCVDSPTDPHTESKAPCSSTCMISNLLSRPPVAASRGHQK
jgi:hypothetical protein